MFIDRFSLRETRIIKGVAVCLMLIHHLFCDSVAMSKCNLLFPKTVSVVICFSYLCKVCVSIFLMLSGFGLFKSFSKYREVNGIGVKNSIKYSVLHIYKLLKGYWWAVVPFAVFGMTTGMRSFETVYGSGKKSIVYLIIDIFGFGARIDRHKMYNTTCWFLAVIIVLYAVFPLLYHSLNNNIIVFVSSVLFFSFLPFGYNILVSRIWLLPFCTGMFIAKFNLFDLAKRTIKDKKTIIGSLLSLLFFCILRRLFGIKIDTLFSISIILTTLIICNFISFVGDVFEFIGKHSMNMFMTHTFFYLYFFEKIIYSPKYPLLVFIFLILICLGYSIVLEKFKSLFGCFIKKINNCERRTTV